MELHEDLVANSYDYNAPNREVYWDMVSKCEREGGVFEAADKLDWTLLIKDFPKEGHWTNLPVFVVMDVQDALNGILEMGLKS